VVKLFAVIGLFSRNELTRGGVLRLAHAVSNHIRAMPKSRIAPPMSSGNARSASSPNSGDMASVSTNATLMHGFVRR
jgi:hypothetical protein